MFESANSGEVRSPIADWCIRGGIGLIFLAAGWEKFDLHSMWPGFFQKVGMGQWFRYFTGIVEIMAGLLTFIPWTAQFGVAILACTMGCAALIWIFVVGPPANAIICGGFSFGLSAFWWSRRSRS